jgi:hypothetical protein
MKVRIYKSPDGNGKYLNKTGQFLKKAQLGGVPAESEMGYPGSSSEKKEATQEELVELIANDLNNNIDEQTISYKLATFYDLEPMIALNLVSQVKEYIESQDVIDYDAYYEDEEEQTTDEEDAEEEDLLEAEAVLNGPGQDLDEASNEIANSESIATQDDGFEDDMFNQYQYQSNQDDEYSYGGLYKAEDGAETSEEMINPNGYVPNYPFDQTRHEITFPGIETYLPYNMSELLDGTVDPATGNYINNLDESEEENVDEYESEYETEDAENNIPANGDYQEGQTVDPSTDPSITQMKKGGSYKRNKRAYVNSILKLAKKAEGGEEKKSDNDPEAGDPTGAKIRKQKLNNFIGSLKKETEMFTLREQAEKQYDQMMQQQQQPQNNMMRRGGPAGSRDPKVVRGNALRYRANQLKDFITGQNRRDREDNIDYHNVNDYPTTEIKNNFSNDGSPKYGPDKDGYKFPNSNQGHVTSSTEPKIGQTYDDWWVTSTGNTPGFYPDNRKWNGKDWVSRTEYYGNSDYSNNVSYDRKPSYTLDVRKSNWLTGKPSKYRIDFYGYSPLVDIANGNNPGVISQKPVVNSSNVSTIVSTVNKSQSTDLQNGYFKTDANGDKIPDYLQPGPLSGLPINGTSNLDVPVVVANTPEEIAKAKELENKKTKKIISNNDQKEILEAKKQVELQKEILEAQRQVELQQQILEAQRQVRLEQQRLNEREQGGFVDSNNPDLYEFNYGGYDPTQQDIDYSNSIDTTDPYFQRDGGQTSAMKEYLKFLEFTKRARQAIGTNDKKELQNLKLGKPYNTNDLARDFGKLQQLRKAAGLGTLEEASILFPHVGQQIRGTVNEWLGTDFQRGGGVRRFIENFVPANVLSNPNTYYNEVQRIYDPKTGKTIPMPSNMGKVSSINVDKSRFWSGKPKKYTINFNGSPNYTVTSPNQKDNKQNNSQRSNVDGLSLQARMAIRKGERQNERNSRRLKRQGLDEYGNRPGDQQGAIYNDGRLTKDREGNWYDRNNAVIPGKKRPSEVPGYYDNNQSNTNEPMSNVEMLKKQGKIWDEKLNKWVNLEIPRLQPLPVGQIDIPRNKNNNWGLMPTDNYQNLYQIQQDIDDGLYGESAELEDFVRSKIATPWEQKTGKKAFDPNYFWRRSDDVDNDPILRTTNDERDSFTKDELKNLTISPDMTISEMKALEERSWNSTDEEKNYFNDVIIPKYNKITGKDYDKEEHFLDDWTVYYDKNTGARVLLKDIPKDKNNNRIWDNYITKDDENREISDKHNADVLKHKLESRKKRGLIPYRYLNKYGGYIPSNYFEYGGLTQMTVGGPPPCGPGEMLDPATNKCKAVSGVLKNNPPNGAPGSPGTIDSWGGTRAAMNPNIPSFANPGTSMKQMMGLDTESMKSFTNPDGTPVGGNTNDPYSIDVKNKRTPLTFGKDNTAVSEARLNMFNAGVDITDSLRRGKESNKAENEMYENLSSNNLYASDPSRDRGDYDTNSGLYRPNEQGQMWNSRSKQFGGYIDEEEYYDPYTEEEDELTYAKGGEKITYMSEDQIRAFMAEGGQVEFL